MKSDEIKNLFFQFEAAASELEGVECWSAREIQNLLGYSKWENFEKVIQKAKEACKTAGEEIDYHFPDVRKMIALGKGAEKEIDDILLTRYACYLVAKTAIAARRKLPLPKTILQFKPVGPNWLNNVFWSLNGSKPARN